MPQKPHEASPPAGEDAEDLKDLYADSMAIDSGLYTATLTFGELRAEKPRLKPCQDTV